MKCFVCEKKFKDEDVMGVHFYMFNQREEKGLRSLKNNKTVWLGCVKELGANKIQELVKDL